MSWTALYQKEMREQVRPAGKLSGMFVVACVLSIVFGAGLAVLVGLVLYNAQRVFPFPDGWPVVVFPALAGLLGTTFGSTLLPMNAGIDSIAGERERHTLETLLAGPVSDRGIVWAKATSIATVAGITGGIGGVAVAITLPILYGVDGLLWALIVVPAALLVPVVPSFMTACTSIVMSMRAKTVKDASQRLGYLIIPFSLMPMAVVFAIDSPVTMVIVLGVAGVLFAIAGIVTPILAFVLFRRDRLIVS